MIRKYFSPLLAVAGVLFAIWTAVQSTKPMPSANAVVEPPQPPYAYKISGSGIVEASTRNIAVGTPVSALVGKVFIRVSQRVQVGDPLFMLDDRKERAMLAVKETALVEARSRLRRLLEAPRKEELPQARAKVREAEAVAEDLRLQLKSAEGVSVQKTISLEDLKQTSLCLSCR
jgi:multidrug efflux pump subunit AcrA (membrane-fusion protein)